MSEKEQGGCLCGAIRYELDRPAVLSAHSCYCKDCQKSIGGGYTTYATLPEQGFTLLCGDPKFYQSTGSNGISRRCFCSDCGSPLWSTIEVAPGLVFIKAGSIDNSDWMQLSSGYWRSSARPWAQPDGSIPVCETNT